MPKEPPKNPRVPVPQGRVDEVMLESDWACVLCRSHTSVQVHHLNEDRTDNSRENLVALCPNCHCDTHGTAGFTRKRTPEQIRKCRDEWYRIVRERRVSGRRRLDLSESIAFETVLNAVAVVRIREIGFRAEAHKGYEELGAFCRGYGPRVALEIISVLADMADVHREDADECARISEMVRQVLPIHTLVGPYHRALEEEERDILHQGQWLGREMAYHASRRSHDLAVLNAGGRVLWTLLRFGVLNEREAALRDSSRSVLGELESLCAETGFEEGRRWIRFLIQDAEQWPEFQGEFPAQLAKKVDAEA